MNANDLARYRAAPDRFTRDALEAEFPGIAAEAARKPVEAAQAREMAELSVPEEDRHVVLPDAAGVMVGAEPEEKPAVASDGPKRRGRPPKTRS